MRDLAFVSFFLLFVFIAFKRPWLMSMVYIWIDILKPQSMTYRLTTLPLSLIAAILAIVFFVGFDPRRGLRWGAIQSVMLMLVGWVTITTFMAELPEHAWVKWDWVWKGIAFGIFLPSVLVSRLRIETTLAFMIGSLGAITISAGAKTLLGGGGYGSLSFLVNNNTGLFESSTIATVAVAMIPMVLYLYNSGYMIAKSKFTLLVTSGLILSSLLVTVGGEARTGLVVAAVLAVLVWLRSRRKLLLALGFAVSGGLAFPFLPASFTDRMSTIKTFDEDSSASTRIAVWKWTIEYVQDHPLGGGFGMYRLNVLEVPIKVRSADGGAETTKFEKQVARAFHSSYFEVLGEQGVPGIIIYSLLGFVAISQLLKLRILHRSVDDPNHWIGNCAESMLMTLLLFAVGAAFVGIAFQPIFFLLLAVAAGLNNVSADVRAAAAPPPPVAITRRPFGRSRSQTAI